MARRRPLDLLSEGGGMEQDPSRMGGGMPPGTTAGMSDADLTGMGGGPGLGGPDVAGADPAMGAPGAADLGASPDLQDPQAMDDMEFQQLQGALEDPTLDPETRQMIQLQLAMAARRSLAGGGF